MKRLAAALAIVAFGAGAAFADTMQNAAANTIVVTPPGGGAVRYHFNSDGTFAAALPDGSAFNGAWEVSGDQICLTPTGGERACTAYVGDKNVGDTWTQTGTDGTTISVTIEAGR